MANGDEQKLAILREVRDVVARMEGELASAKERSLATEARVATLEKTHIEANAFHQAIADHKTYTDQKVEEGIKRGEGRLDDKMGNVRSAILTDVAKTLREREEALLIDRVQPLFERLATERDKRQRAEKELEWQRIKNRLQTVGSLIILLTALVTFYFAFQGNAGPREVNQMSRIGDALTDVQ
ncbi:MAG: hypothetical protein AAFW60_01635 [Pseudomonadota bacterium]